MFSSRTRGGIAVLLLGSAVAVAAANLVRWGPHERESMLERRFRQPPPDALPDPVTVLGSTIALRLFPSGSAAREVLSGPRLALPVRPPAYMGELESHLTATAMLLHELDIDLTAIGSTPRHDAFERLSGDLEEGSYIRPGDHYTSAVQVDKRVVLQWVLGRGARLEAGYAFTYLSGEAGPSGRSFLSQGAVFGFGADF